jgi:Spy/CpxP family protein refolding chaperone
MRYGVAWCPPLTEPAGSDCLGEGEKKMHPGMMAWWNARRHGASCEGGEAHEGRGCGPGWRGHGEGRVAYAAHDDDFGGFGVRRPLRFLSFKLELEEEQVTELARILNDLKMERAQAALDHRRSTAAIADAISGDALDEAKLGEATAARVKSAERLRDAVASAVKRIHAILTAEQRGRLAYLIRTGTLII